MLGFVVKKVILNVYNHMHIDSEYYIWYISSCVDSIYKAVNVTGKVYNININILISENKFNFFFCFKYNTNYLLKMEHRPFEKYDTDNGRSII